MKNPPGLLLHWEALYPYERIKTALSNLELPEEFPKKNILVALPHDYLLQASESLASTGFTYGASDMVEASPASFTGSIATKYLQDVHSQFVLIGNAFKREKLSETSQSFHDKIRKALEANITPYLCFGESSEQFTENQSHENIKKQLQEMLKDFSNEEILRIEFIYDTPHALSTISHFNADQLNRVYEGCKKIYTELWGESVASGIHTFCAFPFYLPIPLELIDSSLFTGFYFKFIDTNLSPFSQTLSTVATLLKNFESEITIKSDENIEEKDQNNVIT